MRRLLPDPAATVDLEQAYALPLRPWVRANMVTSLDGSAVGPDGLSGSVSGPPDRLVFRVLRASCDAVVVGAATAVAEAYKPTLKPLVLLTNSGRIDRSAPVFGDASRRPLVMAPTDADPDALADLDGVADRVLVGRGTVDLVAGLAALRERGLAHLLCEGGPRLLGSLLAASLVDELCLTVAPRVVGGAGARPVVVPGWLDPDTWSLTQLLEDDGFLFCRWRRTPDRED